MNKTFLTLLMAGSVLSGCTMMPGYERPALPVAPTWSAEVVESLPPATKASIQDVAWQEFFLSPGLQTVIETALEGNRDLRAATLNIEAARAAYRIQRADLLPGIDANGSATIQRTSDDLTVPGQDNRSDIYQANIGTTAFELDLFGRVRSMNEAAFEEYLATQEGANAVRIALIAQTANVYLQWLADKKILALTEETLDAQSKSLELISKRNEIGIASRLDLTQAQRAVETARVNKALYERLVAQDKNALTLLMGTAEGTITLPAETLDDIALMENLPVGLPSEVLLLRPDVRQAEHLLLSDNANIGAARAAFFPRISLTGAFGFASDSLSSLFSSGAAGAWSFVPQITMPIFEAGRNLANLDLAEIRKEISIANYEKSIQTAFREVADELVARSTLAEQAQAQTNLVAATQESYDIAQARYTQGVDSFLVVLDAQRELYGAQQSQIDLEKQRLANLVNLYKALGGGAAVQAD